MIFIDTCYLLSLVNTKAKNHKNATIIEDMIKNEKTLINSTVLLEMLNNLHKPIYKPARDKIFNLIKNSDKIDFLTS